MTAASGHVPVRMYSTRFCPYCIAARRLLNKLDVSFEDIGVDGKPELRQEMMQLSGRNTVPQIWIGQTHIGGCDELYGLHQRDALQPLLNGGTI